MLGLACDPIALRYKRPTGGQPRPGPADENFRHVYIFLTHSADWWLQERFGTKQKPPRRPAPQA